MTTPTSPPPNPKSKIQNSKSQPLHGIHPAAALFPLMEGDELAQLVNDIRANGLREEIVLDQGLILDGRNRLRACELAGVKPRFVAWDGQGSPVAFVLSRNLHRRHLDESQRAIIAARSREMFKQEATEHQRAHQFGSPDGNASDWEIKQKRRVSSVSANLRTPRGTDVRAAALLKVSARSVTAASRVLAAGDEQVILAVEAGQISVSDAAAVVDLPKPRQREALARVRAGKARTLRQAAGARKPQALPPAVRASDQSDLSVMRGKVRRAYRYFMADLEALCHYIALAADGSGGPNDFTVRARDALAVAERAMHDCLLQFGRDTSKSE